MDQSELCTEFDEESHLCGNHRVKRFQSKGKRWDYEDHLWCTCDNEGNPKKIMCITF